MDISRFNPHSMDDTQIRLLSTGRDKLIETVTQELTTGQGVRQHVLVSAPRGFGKSFFVRAVEISIEELHPSVRVIVLPEEQLNITTPSGFLREITRALRKQPPSSVIGRFLDDPDGEWEDALADLNEELEKLRPDEIVVLAVENFDDLITKVFDELTDESKLRILLAESKKLALLATATTSEFDKDYDQRLFHAFAKFPLTPWRDDDHIRYFERRAVLEGRETQELDRGKIKAIAQFTGGAPRMVVALSDLMIEDNPLSAAAVIDKLVDELTPYYQNIIERMPARTRTLLDALIRQSEPCSQSELAQRVGTTQNRIAQHFSWLRERHIVIGKRRAGRKDIRFHVADRLFVQFYRKRYLLHKDYTPLAGMAELLDGFFSADENRKQAITLIEEGRANDAGEFLRASLKLNGGELGNWALTTDNQPAIDGLLASENGDHKLALSHYRKALELTKRDEDDTGTAVILGQLGLSAASLRKFPDAIEAHQQALLIWKSHNKPDVVAWVLGQLAQEFRAAFQYDDALRYAEQALQIWRDQGADDRVASLWGEIGENLRRIGKPDKAIDALLKAEDFWKRSEDHSALGWVLGAIGLARRDMGRYREAIQSHREAVDVLNKASNTKRHNQAVSIALNLGWIAISYRRLTEFNSALEYDERALEIWRKMDNERSEIRTLSSISVNYIGLKKFNEAFSASTDALKIARSTNFQSQIIWNAAQLAALHVCKGDTNEVMSFLDDETVQNRRALYETVLTQCGLALRWLENDAGRAQAYEQSRHLLDGLIARNKFIQANDSMTYLLSGMITSKEVSPLLVDLLEEAVSYENGLSQQRKMAMELAVKHLKLKNNFEALEELDPDISAAVQAIVRSAKKNSELSFIRKSDGD